MGFYTVLKNSNLSVELTSDYQDNGWSLLNGKATHSDCNSGSIINTVFIPKANEVYKVVIRVSGLASGSLRVALGGIYYDVTVSGVHTFMFNTLNGSALDLWSDANVVVESVVVYEGESNSKTLLFNEDNNQFVGYRSYSADLTARFIDEFISFKSGALWIHDKNESRNTFFGQEYPSVISFYVNIQAEDNKDFYSIKLEGNQAWSVTVEIPSKEGTRIKKSRIKPGNFVFEKGSFHADFLRDMNDDRFNSELEALMKGAYLVGKYMKVTLTNTSTKPLKLVSASVDVSIK